MDEFIRNAATLEKQLAELQDKLRWRDVREELPPVGEHVMTFNECKRFGYSAFIDENERWTTRTAMTDVTYWLPLRDAPK